MHLNCRIFCESLASALPNCLVGLGLRLDGHGNDRRRESRSIQHDRFIFIAQRIAVVTIFSPNAGSNVRARRRRIGVDVSRLLACMRSNAANALARISSTNMKT